MNAFVIDEAIKMPRLKGVNPEFHVQVGVPGEDIL